MPYGTIKIDTITFTDGGVDKSVPVSGLVLNPTFTGNVTVTGTISGNIIQGGTTVSGLTVTGTTANFASGVFTTQVSGLLITGPTVSATTGTFTSLTGTTTNGTTASFTTGNFTSLTGTTTTGTTANFASGVFTTQVSGLLITGPTVSATTGTFTSLTGTTTTGTTANFASGVFTTQISGVTITGTTVSTTTGNFTSLTGTTATITSGIIASGTAALPSLAILSDPNTGIYSPGADQLAVATNGVERVEFGNSEVVFNDGGADVDFRVEGDTNADLLKVDAGTDTLIIGGKYNILKGFHRRPPLHRGPLFTKTAATTISVVADCSLNGFFYSAATAVTMGSHTNNTDMAIWQHPTTGALVSNASYVTAPAGATGGSIVGGYHYIPSGRPTAFNNGSPTATAEILEYSIWDLTWRPVCPDPRGMTCVDGRFWCDLYFCGSTSYANTTFAAVQSSKIGLTIADNSSPALIPSFYGGNGSTAYTLTGGNNPGSWYNFAEVAHSFGKRFMFSWEFQAAAFGAPEAGSRGSDPGTVIWERASKWGLAQATGTLYTWAIERIGIYTSVSNANTGGRGTEYADAPRALLLSGSWSVGANSGSRNAYWNLGPSDGGGSVGARFAAEHLVLG